MQRASFQPVGLAVVDGWIGVHRQEAFTQEGFVLVGDVDLAQAAMKIGIKHFLLMIRILVGEVVSATQLIKGDIIARMSSDVGAVENSITSSIDMLIRQPIAIIVCFSTMIWVSWQLTLFVLIIAPIAGWIMGTVSRKLKSQSATVQNQWGDLLAQLDETVCVSSRHSLLSIRCCNALSISMTNTAQTSMQWLSARVLLTPCRNS